MTRAPLKVIHASDRGTRAFMARSLETEDEAVIITSPYPPSFAPTKPACGVRCRGGDGICTKPVATVGDRCHHHRDAVQ